MARWIVAGLIVLNALLGIGVYQRLMEKPAQAQIGGAARDYVSVAGYSGGETIIYVLEPSSGRLAGLRAAMVDNRLSVVAARSVAQDFARVR